MVLFAGLRDLSLARPANTTPYESIPCSRLVLMEEMGFRLVDV
jgi:hypothetical protein